MLEEPSNDFQWIIKFIEEMISWLELKKKISKYLRKKYLDDFLK